LQFIEENKDKPFFCYVTHHVVHRPVMEKPELVSKYEAKPGVENPVNNPIMGAMIEVMDNGIGQILNKLDELGLTENTIVVFYSDNGGFEQLQKQDPLKGGKAMIFEGGIKVPMAIKWPGVIKKGSKSNTPVISDDFFPTFADILSVKNIDKNIDGVSLMPLLKGEGEIDRNTLYFHYPHYHHLGYKPAGAVREGDFKLIEWFEDAALNKEGAYQLYNVREDVGEKNDLSKEMPELVEKLKKKLHEWRKKIDAQEMDVNPNFDPKKAHWRFKDRKGYYVEDGVVRT
jgi:arylsulfatase A